MDLTKIEPSVVEASVNGKNFLFYGGPGTWKTTVASQFPHPIFAATERGFKFINGVYAQMITNWREAKEFLRELAKPEVEAKYETVVFDRIDTLYNYCYDYVLKVNNAVDPSDPIFNGSGWSKIKAEWNKYINGLESLNYGLVFICHDSDNSKYDEADTGAAKIDLQRPGIAPLRGVCDFIFNVVRENEVQIVDGKSVPTGETNCYAYSNLISTRTKKRERYFPDKFLFTFKTLNDALEGAIKQQEKIEGITAKAYERKVDRTKRPYDDIYQSVVKKVTELASSQSPYMSEVMEVQRNLIGKKLGEIANDDRYYERLLTYEEYLSDKQ
jgi:hypothetical protein